MKNRRKIFKALRRELSFIRKALGDVNYIKKYFLSLPEVEHGVFYVNFENVLGYRTSCLGSEIIYSQLLIAPNLGFYRYDPFPEHLFLLIDDLGLEKTEYGFIRESMAMFSKNMQKLSTTLDFFLYIEGDYICQSLVDSIFKQIPSIESELKKGQDYLLRLRDLLTAMDSKGCKDGDVDRNV